MSSDAPSASESDVAMTVAPAPPSVLAAPAVVSSSSSSSSVVAAAATAEVVPLDAPDVKIDDGSAADVKVSHGLSTTAIVATGDVSGLDEDTTSNAALQSIPSDATINIKCLEGTIVTVNTKCALRSSLIREALSSDPTATDFNMDKLEQRYVECAVRWLTYHGTVEPKVIPKPLPSTDMVALAGEWDAKFAAHDDNQDLMFGTMLAANYMDIPPLLELTVAQIASLLKDKSPEEIRAKFQLRAEYTPEEEELAKKEFKDLLE